MTDKKSQKVPTKALARKLKLSPDYKPFELVTPTTQDLVLRNSPIQMANQYTTLGTIPPRPTFQSALISQFDPFVESIPLKPFISPRRFERTSPYHAKSSSHNLFFVESDFSHLKSPEAITKAYYPSLWHFPAIHSEKSLKFYRDILFQTKSIQINPIYCKQEMTKVIFHSLFIMKFISQSDWGTPHALRSLENHNVRFSYHDYIEAWYKIFLYQNETYTHSWFINFDKNFKGPIPLWFHRWCQVHGPVNEIIP
jgi:hypothetical protein